jgi:hypothetical protein
LADPTAQLLEAWSVTAPAAEPSERRLLVVEQPSELRSLAVQMGRHVVFLPTPVGADADLYDRLARDQSRAGGGRVQATLKR